MDSAKKVRWIIPFKKFGMVRVKDLPVGKIVKLHNEKDRKQYVHSMAVSVIFDI